MNVDFLTGLCVNVFFFPDRQSTAPLTTAKTAGTWRTEHQTKTKHIKAACFIHTKNEYFWT